MKYFLSLLSLLYCVHANAQLNGFQKVVGKQGQVEYSNLLKVLQRNDGNTILGFTRLSTSSTFLVHTDTLGQATWAKSYGTIAGGTIGGNICSAICTTKDGGYLMAGYCADTGGDNTVLCRIDSIGNIRWSYRYKTSAPNKSLCIMPTPDGGFLSGGTIGISLPFDNDAFLLKVDSNGQVLWTKRFGDRDDDGVVQLIPKSNGRFIASGYLYSAASQRQGFYLMEMDSLGHPLHTSAFTSDSSEISVTTMAADSMGRIIIAGNVILPGSILQSCILKADSNYHIYLARRYVMRGYNILYGMSAGLNRYAICGFTSDSNQIYRDAWMATVDSDCNPQHAISFGGSGQDVAAGISSLKGTSYAIAGSTSSFGIAQPTGYLVQVDSALQQSCVQAELILVRNLNIISIIPAFNFASDTVVRSAGLIASNATALIDSVCNLGLGLRPLPSLSPASALIVPNPSSGTFTVTLSEPGCILEVINMLGQQVFSKMLSRGVNKISLDHSSPGIYVYLLHKGSNPVQRGQLIVQ